MGYGDYIPSGGQHSKKPLTKAQIRKLQAAYAQAGAISEEVKELESEEQKNAKGKIEELLNLM